MPATMTANWLRRHGACSSAISAFELQRERKTRKILDLLLKRSRFDWCFWLLLALMTFRQQLQYTLFMAHRVIRLCDLTPSDRSEFVQLLRRAENLIAAPRRNRAAFNRVNAEAQHLVFAMVLPEKSKLMGVRHAAAALDRVALAAVSGFPDICADDIFRLVRAAGLYKKSGVRSAVAPVLKHGIRLLKIDAQRVTQRGAKTR